MTIFRCLYRRLTCSAAEGSTELILACGLMLLTRAACSVLGGSGTSSVYRASPVTCKVYGILKTHLKMAGKLTLLQRRPVLPANTIYGQFVLAGSSLSDAAKDAQALKLNCVACCMFMLLGMH